VTQAPAGEDAFADLLDDLFEQLLNGFAPDVAATRARHPAVAHRLDEALALAAGLAGRKVSTRPALQGYEIVRELGMGGMGTVYLARHATLPRDVAVKVLPHSFGMSVGSRQRFLEEAQALARVKHEHIVDLHRIVDDGELLAFEMEYVDGPSLQHVLTALREHREKHRAQPGLAVIADVVGVPTAQLGARNPTQFFVRLVLKLARALATVHAAGFVHRDVKPANVLLRRNGEPVLVDFGLVRPSGLEATHAGRFAGTPVYSSPEQLRGEAGVGPASDVYSLAVTLYECLTLTTPFVGRTTTALLQRIEQGRFAPLRHLAPEASRDLETIVAHAMEVDPRRRYSDGGALADDLQRLLDLQPIHVTPAGWLERSAKLLRRQRRSLLAAAAGAVLVAAALFPVVRHVEAANRSREEQVRVAAEHVMAARQQLIAVGSSSLDWRRAVWGLPTRQPLVPQQERLQPLRGAIEQYERALATVADDEVARREADVVRLAIWLQQLPTAQPGEVATALASAPFAQLAGELGPGTAAAARALATGGEPAVATAAAAGAVDDADRTSLGLLTFLFGDFATCAAAWQGVPANAPERPLIDAGLGMVLLAEGMPDAAHVRLLQADRHFPGSGPLALEIAETALRIGDVALAAQSLARVPDGDATALRKRRIALDLQAATSPGAELTAAYEELATLDPDDPVAPHRVAMLALRRGDLARAVRLLDALLAQWPRSAQLRLDRARVALQRRDLAAYARQVLAVLEGLPGRERARGSTADLLEVLRIGGLESLYLENVAAAGGERAGRTSFGGEMPIHAFAPAALTRRFEASVRWLHVVDRATDWWRAHGCRLDPWAERCFVALPTAFARLPVPLPAPWTRATLALLPALAGRIVPPAAVVARDVALRFGWRGWTRIQLEPIARPALPEPLVFGSAIAAVGDASGDGADDVLITATTPDPARAPGWLLLVDGASAETVGEWQAEGGSRMFAHSVARAGDCDGDGRADWLVGAPAGARGTRGQVEIWSGATLRPLARVDSPEPGFGVSVAGLGDVDGDGCADFAVGAPAFARNTTAQGCVVVWSGRERTVLRTLPSDVAGVWFGACVANAGDADGDGVADLVVGGNFGAAPGLVRLYSGASGALLHQWTDASPANGFGAVVAGVGDLDGDGRADVAVSAVRDGDGNGADQVLLYSGATGRPIATLTGSRPGTRFGSAVVRYAGNAGSTVLVIGSPTGGPTGHGAVEFWAARGVLLSSLLGPAGAAGFGAAIALVPDTDGDGLRELFVASPIGPGHVMRVRSTQVRFTAR
jgi:serine/threonine protein kinase/tetratricopeptide (TPR) repeat protein